jgi:chemotaxis methyl-accepting protein methylase
MRVKADRNHGAGERFFESPAVWDFVRDEIYPRVSPIRREVRTWCVGETARESAIALAILWLAGGGKTSGIRLLATHHDGAVLEAEKERRYSGAERDAVPRALREAAFNLEGDDFLVRAELSEMIQTSRLDLAAEPWPREVDLVVIDGALVASWTPAQRFNAIELAARSLQSHSWLIVTGGTLPVERDGQESPFERLDETLPIYRRLQ